MSMWIRNVPLTIVYHDYLKKQNNNKRKIGRETFSFHLRVSHNFYHISIFSLIAEVRRRKKSLRRTEYGIRPVFSVYLPWHCCIYTYVLHQHTDIRSSRIYALPLRVCSSFSSPQWWSIHRDIGSLATLPAATIFCVDLFYNSYIRIRCIWISTKEKRLRSAIRFCDSRASILSSFV